MENLNILHIEDDLSDAFLIESLLKHVPNNLFANIKNVGKLSEGLKELQTNAYNVILLDLDLLDVKGIDNLKCIKEENPDIPIIILTGKNNDTLAKEALMEGAQEYLFKGQSSTDILKRVISSSILRKSVENDLKKKLYYDSLTQLPNRTFFTQIAETLLTKAQRRKISESIMFIDLNRFKSINDNHGHEAGNHVLTVAAHRMKSALRSSDIIARYAGDEFIVYLGGEDMGMTQAECAHIAKKLISAVREPIIYKDTAIKTDLSIGISMFPSDGITYSDLVDQADLSMYSAKKTQQGYALPQIPYSK